MSALRSRTKLAALAVTATIIGATGVWVAKSTSAGGISGSRPSAMQTQVAGAGSVSGRAMEPTKVQAVEVGGTIPLATRGVTMTLEADGPCLDAEQAAGISGCAEVDLDNILTGEPFARVMRTRFEGGTVIYGVVRSDVSRVTLTGDDGTDVDAAFYQLDDDDLVAFVVEGPFVPRVFTDSDSSPAPMPSLALRAYNSVGDLVQSM